jgi:hypothetical protein
LRPLTGNAISPIIAMVYLTLFGGFPLGRKSVNQYLLPKSIEKNRNKEGFMPRPTEGWDKRGFKS